MSTDVIEPFQSKQEAMGNLLRGLGMSSIPDSSNESKAIESKMVEFGYSASDQHDRRATALAYVIALNTISPTLRLTKQEALLLAAVPEISPTLRQFPPLLASVLEGKSFDAVEPLVREPSRLTFDVFPTFFTV